jgi:LacI family transcriptional regulator
VSSVILSDVAERCGVSRATVSLVLQDSRRVSVATKMRVRQALAEMGYVYDRRAANLRGGRTFALGLLLTDVRNSALAELAMGIEDRADEMGYVVMMGYSGDLAERQSRILNSMLEHRLDGIVLSPAVRTSPGDLEPLLRSGTPHVLVTRRVRGFAADYVGPDNAMGGRELADHLVALGVKTVAFLGGAAGVSARSEREGGLRRQLQKRGVLWRPELSHVSNAGYDGGVDATNALLDTARLPDAIVAYSDMVAMGVLAELGRRGIRAGQDVAVAAFDDSPAAIHMQPPLTSVGTLLDRVGSEAVRLLVEGMTDPTHDRMSVLLKLKVEPRRSTLEWSKKSRSAGQR